MGIVEWIAVGAGIIGIMAPGIAALRWLFGLDKRIASHEDVCDERNAQRDKAEAARAQHLNERHADLARAVEASRADTRDGMRRIHERLDAILDAQRGRV